MVPLSQTAREQYFSLILHYLKKEREEPVIRLIGALEEARRLISADYLNAVDHPSVYGGLRWEGVRWIKCHRYWFSFTVDQPVIFNIIWDGANIPRRAVGRPSANEDTAETG